MSKHTPTPWKVNTKVFISGAPVIEAEQGFVATAHDNAYNDMPDGEALANAEYICRSVNSHEALVEALEEAVRELAAIDAEGGMGDYAEFLTEARAALKLARKE